MTDDYDKFCKHHWFGGINYPSKCYIYVIRKKKHEIYNYWNQIKHTKWQNLINKSTQVFAPGLVSALNIANILDSNVSSMQVQSIKHSQNTVENVM